MGEGRHLFRSLCSTCCDVVCRTSLQVFIGTRVNYEIAACVSILQIRLLAVKCMIAQNLKWHPKCAVPFDLNAPYRSIGTGTSD